MYSAIMILFLIPFVSILMMPGRRSFYTAAAILAALGPAYWGWWYPRLNGDPFGIVILILIIVPWGVGWAAGVGLKSAWLWRGGKPQARPNPSRHLDPVS